MGREAEVCTAASGGEVEGESYREQERDRVENFWRENQLGSHLATDLVS